MIPATGGHAHQDAVGFLRQELGIELRSPHEHVVVDDEELVLPTPHVEQHLQNIHVDQHGLAAVIHSPVCSWNNLRASATLVYATVPVAEHLAVRARRDTQRQKVWCQHNKRDRKSG